MSNTRYVSEGPEGDWEILKEGHRRATVRSGTKAGAVRAARNAVRKEGGGEVLVMNRTGKVIDAKRVDSPKRRAAA